MDDLSQKLSAMLSDPQTMEKVIAMAQSLGNQAPAPASPPKNDPPPDIDLGMLQKISGLARQSTIDNDQRQLLRALGPYLSRERIGKLERAMRAAKMARMASGFLNAGGSFQGR